MPAAIEFHVYCTSPDGQQARVPFLRIQGGDTANAVRLALTKHMRDFRVMLDVDDRDGGSSEQVAEYRDGKPLVAAEVGRGALA